VAAVLGHVAFWDGRALRFAERLAGGEELSHDDAETGSVDWINDASKPLFLALSPRLAADLTVRAAGVVDRLV